MTRLRFAAFGRIAGIALYLIGLLLVLHGVGADGIAIAAILIIVGSALVAAGIIEVHRS